MYGKITTVTPGPMGETEIDREVTMQCFPVLVLRLLGDLFFFWRVDLIFLTPCSLRHRKQHYRHSHPQLQWGSSSREDQEHAAMQSPLNP